MANNCIRIGMASAYFALMKGGGEHYTLHLSNKLADSGHEITIICGKQPFKEPDPLSNRLKINYSMQLFFLRDWAMKGKRPFNGIASVLHSRQFLASCYYSLLKDNRFDIIHTHDPISHKAALKLKIKTNVPVVSSLHGYPPIECMKDLKNTDAVLPVSDEIKTYLEGYGVENIYVIPGGVDIAHFRLLDKSKCKQMLGLKGRIILFVGRLIPIKNISSLLRSFRKVHLTFKDMRLIIIGDGILRKELEIEARNLGLNECVTFLGPISYMEMPIYYNAADVFVLPSTFESFSLVALEAAACGVPVAISIGAKAFIDDFGKNFIFTFDPYDINSIGDAIIRALTEEDLCSKIKSARLRAENYDWEFRARQVSWIYKDVISNG